MRNGKTLVLSYAIANLLFAGCGTTQKSDFMENFGSISQKYQTQAYDECLAEISKLMAKAAPAGRESGVEHGQGPLSGGERKPGRRGSSLSEGDGRLSADAIRGLGAEEVGTAGRRSERASRNR